MPGGYNNLRLHVKIGTPHPVSMLLTWNAKISAITLLQNIISACPMCQVLHLDSQIANVAVLQEKVDVEECRKIFPYGQAVIEVSFSQ